MNTPRMARVRVALAAADATAWYAYKLTYFTRRRVNELVGEITSLLVPQGNGPIKEFLEKQRTELLEGINTLESASHQFASKLRELCEFVGAERKRAKK